MDVKTRDALEDDGRIAVLVWIGAIVFCIFVSICRSAGITLTGIRDAIPEVTLAAVAVACLFFIFVLWRTDQQRRPAPARSVERPIEPLDACRLQAAVVVINGAAYVPVDDLVADLLQWEAPRGVAKDEARGFRRAIGDVRRYVETLENAKSNAYPMRQRSI